MHLWKLTIPGIYSPQAREPEETVQRPVSLRSRKDPCFSLKGGEKPMEQVKGSQAGGIPSYSAGISLLFYSGLQLMG